jgi:hypothetical protein
VSGKHGTLEIEEDLDFQRKEWTFQRVGVTLLFLFVIGALLGLTGMGGLFARGEASDASGAVHVEYERFVRRGSSSRITAHFHSTPGAVRFWVGTSYLERVDIDSVVPEPENVSVEANRHVYVIRAGSPDVSVTVNVKHGQAGTLHGEIGLVDGPSVRFSQLSIF